jgi:hypothetical protein
MGVEIFRGDHFLEFKDPFNLPGKQWVKGLFKGTIRPVKRYSVTGYIRFDFVFRSDRKTNLPDAKTLRQAIFDTDRSAPWKYVGSPKSIQYLGPGAWIDCQSNDVCIFQIEPPNRTLTQEQMYAYEKYLAVLADTLAKMGIPGVESVICSIEASTSQRFMAPESQK